MDYRYLTQDTQENDGNIYHDQEGIYMPKLVKFGILQLYHNKGELSIHCICVGLEVSLLKVLSKR